MWAYCKQKLGDVLIPWRVWTALQLYWSGSNDCAKSGLHL